MKSCLLRHALVLLGSAGAAMLVCKHPDEALHLQEPTMTYSASEYCGSKHPYGRHAFAGSAAADAFVLTSLTGQVPVLHTAQDGGLFRGLAGSHNLPVTAVDWHPQMNIIISASADSSAHLSYLDL